MVVFSGSGNETQRAVSSIEDWSNDEEIKYYVIYSEYLGEKQFEIKGYTYTNIIGAITFKSKEDAQKSLDEHLNEWKIVINWRTTYE